MLKQEKQEFSPKKRQQKILNQTSFLKEEAENLDGSITIQIKRKRNRKRKQKTKKARSQSNQKEKKNKNNVKKEALSKSFSYNNKKEDLEELEESENYYIDRPQKIIGMRYNKKTRQNEYLVKWLNYNESESTWESINNLKGCKVLISIYMQQIQRKLPVCDPLFQLPPMPNVKPIAIISIQDGYCWLSWPFRDNYEKPDATRVREVCAKQQYPKLYKERQKYEQIIKKGYKEEANEKLISIQDYDGQALCVYDIRKGLCLLIVRNNDQLQWVWRDRKQVNPILILEYFSVQSWIYKL